MKRIALILLAALMICACALAEEPSESLQAQIDSVISGLDLSSLESEAGTYTVPAEISVRGDGNVGIMGSYEVSVRLTEESESGGGHA